MHLCSRNSDPQAVEATPELHEVENATTCWVQPNKAHQRHGLSIEQLFEPNVRRFVARLDGVVVRCGGVAMFDEHAEVKRLYTRPVVRGRGVAKALLRKIEEEVRGAGKSVLRLETGTNQQEAIGLYEAMGFQPTGPFGPYAAMPARNIETSLFFEKVLR